MNQRTILLSTALLGMLAVALGAFGAHALKAALEATGKKETYELAVRYHFYHTLALLGAGSLIEKFPSLKVASVFFVLGIIIFSGSLYVLALTGQTWLGAMTPVGGVLLLGGWISFGWAVLKS